MTSTQTDRIGTTPPVRVFAGGATYCQLTTADSIVEINAGSVAWTVALPTSGGPYTIVDGADVASAYPITIQDATGSTVGAITANCGSASFAWDGNEMLPMSLPASGSFASIAALRLNATTPQVMAWVCGYYAAADGGEGMFVYNASDTTSADNGGTIIVDAAGNRWYRAKAKSAPLNILQFGGSNNGTTDNLAAWNAMAAVMATQNGGAKAVWSPGKYAFSGQASFAFPAGVVFSLEMEGYGAVLFWPNVNGGFAFNKVLAGHQVSMAGMHITTGVAGGGNGVTINQTDPLLDFFQDVFTDVVFRGSDNNGHTGGLFYWSNGGLVNNNSGTYWEGCTFYGGNVSTGVYGGTGLNFMGTGAGGSNSWNYSIYHNVESCIFNGLDFGHIYNSYAQGLEINQCNTQNTSIGFYVPPGATGQLSQLMISASQYACTVAQILIEAPVGNVMIQDNDIFGVAGHSGIFLEAAAGFTISGNSCESVSPAGSVGIFVANNSDGFPSTISGNGINGAGIGVQLGSGSNNTIVSGNGFANCTAAYLDQGTGNVIQGNLGIVPVQSGPSPSASPWLYTTGSRPEVLYISATTSINSITQADTTPVLPAPTGPNVPFTIHLAPQTSVSISYSGTLRAYGTKL